MNNRTMNYVYRSTGTQTLDANQVAKEVKQNRIYPLASAAGNLKFSSTADRDNKRTVLELLYQLDANGNKTFRFELSQLNPLSLDGVQIHKAKRLVFNKVFQETYFNNDIALIELDRDVQFSDHIRPICLFNRSLYNTGNRPSSAENDLIKKVIINGFGEEDVNSKDLSASDSKSDFENEERWLMHQQFEAYGFGRIGYNAVGSARLQKTTFHYVPLDECRAVWQTKISLYGGLINESHLCVSNKYSTIW